MKLHKILLLIVNIVLVIIFVRFFLADIYAKNIDFLVNELEFEKAVASANKAVELNPREPYYYRQRAKVFLLKAAQQDQDKKVYKNHALLNLREAYMLNPDNLATIRNSIPYYYFLAKDNFGIQKAPKAESALDQDYIEETLYFYEMIKVRFSTDAGAIVTVAKYEKQLGLTEEYNKSVGIIKNLRPELLKWYPGFAY